MDGSSFAGMVEVTQDQFRGSLALPVMNKPTMGNERDADADGELPAGKRTDWHKAGTFYGPIVATRIITPTGARYWLHSSMPIRTHAEAMAEFASGIKAGAQYVIEKDRADERAAAAKAGLSVEAYRAQRRLDAMRKRFDDARRRHEDERRELEGGSWLRAARKDINLSSDELAQVTKQIPGNRWK